MRLLFLVSIHLLTIGNIFSQSVRRHLDLSVDSVFITAYEEKITTAPTYIFFYLTLRNRSSDTVNLAIRRYPFENRPNDQFFLIYQGDTLELYGGTHTRSVFSVRPQSTFWMDMNIDPDDLFRVYQKNANEFLMESDFLRHFALHSKIYLNTRQFKLEAVHQPRKTRFRHSSDTSEQNWK